MNHMADETNPDLEQEVEDSRPEWLPENFENGEAFAKSYKELQARFTQETQAHSEVKQRLEQVEQYVQTQQQQPQYEAYEQQLEESYEANPIQTMSWLAQQAAANAVQQLQAQQYQQQQPHMEAQHHLVAYTADQMLYNKYGEDWGTKDQPGYNQKVAQYLHENPDMLTEADVATPETAARKLERVYELVKGSDIMSQIEQGQVPQALDTRQQKLAAQTLAGAAGRPAQASDDEEHFNRMKAMHQQTYAAHMDAGTR